MSKKSLISKDLYESIMNGITSGVWAADRNDVIHYANRAMEMIAGVTQQRLIGSEVFSKLAENATQYFKLHYLEAKDTLKPVNYSDVPVVTPATMSDTKTFASMLSRMSFRVVARSEVEVAE